MVSRWRGWQVLPMSGGRYSPRLVAQRTERGRLYSRYNKRLFSGEVHGERAAFCSALGRVGKMHWPRDPLLKASVGEARQNCASPLRGLENTYVLTHGVSEKTARS